MVGFQGQAFGEACEKLRDWAGKTRDQVLEFYNRQTPGVKIACVVGAVLLIFGDLWVLFHYQQILHFTAELGDKWSAWGTPGVVIMFLAICIVAFPPLIGFNNMAMICGMAYGLSGWPLLAAAVVCGSTASFSVFKYFLQDRAQQLADQNDTYQLFIDAIADPEETPKQRIGLLALLRLAPLPYSLSNGVMAAIPGVSISEFAIATALTTPKYIMQIVVATRLKHIGEDSSSPFHVVDFLIIISLIGAFTYGLYVLYHRMQHKLQERQYMRSGRCGSGGGSGSDNALPAYSDSGDGNGLGHSIDNEESYEDLTRSSPFDDYENRAADGQYSDGDGGDVNAEELEQMDDLGFDVDLEQDLGSYHD